MDYETTAEFIIIHVKKTYKWGNYVAEVLQTIVKADFNEWKPLLCSSEATDNNIKAREIKNLKLGIKLSFTML